MFRGMERVSENFPHFELIKKRLLAEFPRERLTGLNIERAENFIRQKGLEIKPFIMFEKKDYKKVMEIVGETGLIGSVFDEDAAGLYIPEIDLILIERDKDYEESSGAIYTEGLLVHELAHASSRHYEGSVRVLDEGLYSPRVGLCVLSPEIEKTSGLLLEEGWADMQRADYFAQNASAKEREVLERVSLSGKLNMNDTVIATPPKGEILPLPIKYFYVTPQGNRATKLWGIAGFLLELLCKKNPSLKSSLIKSRSSDEGLREVAKAIESIKPGLYKNLKTSNCTTDSCIEKLSMVIYEVMGGIENVIIASGSLREQWNEVLKNKKT